MVLGDLLRWWEDGYFSQTSAYPQSCGTFRKHLLGAVIAKLRVQEITTGRVEQFIQAKTRESRAAGREPFVGLRDAARPSGVRVRCKCRGGGPSLRARTDFA